jgi:hypothetical protein
MIPVRVKDITHAKGSHGNMDAINGPHLTPPEPTMGTCSKISLDFVERVIIPQREVDVMKMHVDGIDCEPDKLHECAFLDMVDEGKVLGVTPSQEAEATCELHLNADGMATFTIG